MSSQASQIDESDSNADDGSLPEYETELELYHAAFQQQLRRAIDALPLPIKAQILDIPCGDGFYTRMLAECAGSGATVIGTDLLPALLNRAERKFADQPHKEGTATVQFRQADVYALPFDDASFDLVWCAQSFITLDQPVEALMEMHRVLKPGGQVAVLESDEFHHLVVPWPAGLEVSLQSALQVAALDRYGDPGKLYVSRRIRPFLRAAGFVPPVKSSYVADRHAPLDPVTARYMSVHLDRLREFVLPYLAPTARVVFEPLTDSKSNDYLLANADFEVTCLFTVWSAMKRDGRAE